MSSTADSSRAGAALSAEASSVARAPAESTRYALVDKKRISSMPPPHVERPKPVGAFDPALDVAWQRLWLATRRKAWTTLAIVPVSADLSALPTARALASVGWYHLDRPVDVLDATETDLSALQEVLDDLGRRRSARRITVVAVGPAGSSPVSAGIARAVDAALLALHLGDRVADAERALEDIGAEHFLGSVLVRTASENERESESTRARVSTSPRTSTSPGPRTSEALVRDSGGAP
jgi:hypothetical protein